MGISIKPSGGPSSQISLRSILVNDGDSMSATNGSTSGVTLLTYCTPQIPLSGVLAQNVSISGQPLSQMVTLFSSHVTPYYNASVPFIVHIMGGTNDIRAGAAAATIIANLKSYVNLVHALGSNAKCILGTTPLQCDVLGNGTWKAALQVYNDDVIAKWNIAQGSGGYGADGLANYWADPTIGANSYASSAFCSAVYSADGQHGTDLTKSIMGPIEAAAVLPFL